MATPEPKVIFGSHDECIMYFRGLKVYFFLREDRPLSFWNLEFRCKPSMSEEELLRAGLTLPRGIDHSEGHLLRKRAFGVMSGHVVKDPSAQLELL